MEQTPYMTVPVSEHTMTWSDFLIDTNEIYHELIFVPRSFSLAPAYSTKWPGHSRPQISSLSILSSLSLSIIRPKRHYMRDIPHGVRNQIWKSFYCLHNRPSASSL